MVFSWILVAMENFEKCTVAMLGGPCSQHVTGNTSRQNQPQSAINIYIYIYIYIYPVQKNITHDNYHIPLNKRPGNVALLLRCLLLCLLLCFRRDASPVFTLQWRHNERDGVSNHLHLDYLLKRLFRRRSKETSKLRVTDLCEGNPPVIGGFPSQRASIAENVSIRWRHHGQTLTAGAEQQWLKIACLFGCVGCKLSFDHRCGVKEAPIVNARGFSVTLVQTSTLPAE